MSIIYTTADGRVYETGDGAVLVIGTSLLTGMITDRTWEDVNRWRLLRNKGLAGMTVDERSEWMNPMKGRYDYTDLNRVEVAVRVISNRVRELGYVHPSLTTKTNWTRDDVPTREDWERYFSNVETLRSVIPVFDTTPDTPVVGQKLNYARANDIEQILVDIDDVAMKIQDSWQYAGDFYLGEV